MTPLIAPLMFSVICDAAGKIETVLHTGHIRLAGLDVDAQLTDLVDADCRVKLTNMLSSAHESGLALNWPLDIVVDNRIESLGFSAVSDGIGDIVVAARLVDSQIAILDDLASQESFSSLMRERLGEATRQLRISHSSENEDFDELTGLYNEMSRLQRQVSKKNVELQALNALKNQFVGMAAHDMRNPLGNIMNYSELLADEDSLTEDERKMFIQGIHRLSTTMLNLVEDLLDITSIESGRLNLRLETVDIGTLARECTDRLSIFGRSLDVGIRLSVEREGIELHGDSEKIMQILDNLVDNAMSHSPAGSFVDLRVEENDGQVVIVIGDTGPGIPDDLKDSLFIPFHHGATKGRRHQSRGLGLAIVKRLVDAHHGQIEVDSQIGVGTRFILRFPPQGPSSRDS